MTSADDVLLFVHVVDLGSFSKVAEKMRLTNSVVSKRIGRLEESLNVQLLYRTTRRLSLTDAGRALYEKARLAKIAISEATDSVMSYSDSLHGRIVVKMPDLGVSLGFCHAIAEFCKLYPEINIEVLVDNNKADLIDDGIDLSFCLNQLEDSSFIARRLTDIPWVVCATPEYLKKTGIPQHPVELDKHECILFRDEHQSSASWEFSQRNKIIRQALNGRLIMDNLMSIRNAALSGLGICILPRQLVENNIARGELKPVLESFSKRSMSLYAVYPKLRKPDQRIKLLIEHLKQAI